MPTPRLWADERDAPAASIVPLDTLARQRSAAALYREVFGYRDVDHAVNPKLLQGLLDNAGTALGVFDADGRALGFCYGFTAVDGGGLYHYSQATVIAESEQGRGLGRALKRAQADAALGFGARSMRWTYDPALVRNGHFNLDVLGAVGLRFRADYYGEPGSDRVIVDWPLEAERVASVAALRTRIVDEASEAGSSDSAVVRVTGDADRRAVSAPVVAGGAPGAGTVALEHRAALGQAFASAVADGLVALSCRTSARAAGAPATAVYLFGRES